MNFSAKEKINREKTPVYSLTIKEMTAGQFATVISALENYAKGSPIAEEMLEMIKFVLSPVHCTGYVRKRLHGEEPT